MNNDPSYQSWAHRRSSFIFFITLSSLTFLSSGQAQPKPNTLPDSYQSYLASKESSQIHLNWVSVGPVVNSARIESIQGDPRKPGVYYAAFGSGNLWKTEDGGLHWKPIFDNQPSHGIGDIALAPSNSDIIYLGTGESLRKRRNFTLPGTGVYRSTDAGNTWNHLGLENTWHIGEIAVHPEDPNIAFVAAMGPFWSPSEEKGVFRTKNGGQDWEKVLYVDENTRANDIVIAPSNPEVIYASMWENHPTAELSQSVWGPNSGVHVSRDGGTSWMNISEGLPQGPKKGRIGLAVSWSNPEKVYALIDNLNKERTLAPEIYVTENGGRSWNRTHKNDLTFSSVIGWYFMDIYVNPQDDNEIYALGVKLARSRDGGRTFEYLEGEVHHLHPTAAQTLHLDQCELWIHPENPDLLLLGNDGGLYSSLNRGESWLHHNNIPAGEFYDIEVEQRPPYRIFGGTQDNSTVYGPLREFNTSVPDPWKYLWIDPWSGGDGCITQLDPWDPNTVYFSQQVGATVRLDFEADSTTRIKPGLTDTDSIQLDYNFIGPYIHSKHTPNTLYQAGSYVVKTSNKGDSWELINQNLTQSSDPEKTSFAAGTIAESPLVAGDLYVGMDHGAFWVSREDEQGFDERSDGLPNGYIRSIFPSVYESNRVYLTMTGLNYDELNAYVYISEDKGNTWKSLSDGLPNQPANVILEDPFHEDILYVGMHRGVYVSVDRGSNWQLLGTELPAVPVADMDVQRDTRQLVIATHGRGIYSMPLDPFYSSFETGFLKSESVPDTEARLFIPSEIKAPTIRNTYNDIELSNLEKMPISFWLDASERVILTIEDKDGRALWNKELEAKSGLNQYRWDLVTRTTESNLPYFIHHNEYISEGDYFLKLTHSKGTLTEPFKAAGHGN